ncbi:MAG: NDP-sugar synthase [Cyanobacteria bacterium]|nr:NDP-sugar synthase [Cyanobacteriota bacterium]
MTRLRAFGASSRQALQEWPALILAAGLGTRLQPLSSVRAKPALPIAGVPLITRTLQSIRAAGMRRVVINLHSCASSITRIVGDGSQFDLDVRYSWETNVLGSAGGPARAMPLLAADRFLIVNGDMITNVDLRELAHRHVDANALVTMAVIDADPRYNAIVADEAGIVRGFSTRTSSTEAPRHPGTQAPRHPGTYHFVGVQAVNASVFAGVDPAIKSETVHGIYPALIASRPEALRVFHSNAEYFDIGSPRDYLDTARTMSKRESKPLDRGVDCEVATGAQLVDTILWDRVRVGAGASLTSCIVADDVIVPPGAQYSHSALVMGENGLSAHRWNPA